MSVKLLNLKHQSFNAVSMFKYQIITSHFYATVSSNPDIALDTSQSRSLKLQQLINIMTIQTTVSVNPCILIIFISPNILTPNEIKIL